MKKKLNFLNQSLIRKIFVFNLIIMALFACQESSQEGKKQMTNSPNLAQVMPDKSSNGDITLEAGFESPYLLKGSSNEELFLAIKIKTGKMKGETTRSPLNISLVIDQSGSMRQENKLDFAIKAAEMAIDNLTSNDYLSVVAYETEVKVLQTSQKVNDKTFLKNLVRKLRPEGSTYLSGGMEKGYEQVRSTFKPQAINRILLLSDGLANQGETSNTVLQEIAANYYKNEKIAISTFGLGEDFNENLMTNLAEYGHGNYYFIDKSQKIPEIFRKEMQGLLSVVAQKAKLKIQFPADYIQVLKSYGYEHTVSKNEIVIDFNDLFAEEEKVVLLKLKLQKPIDKNLDFMINFTYQDANANHAEKQLTKQLTLMPTDDKNVIAKNINEEITKYKILFLANERFETATTKVDEKEYEKAKILLKENTIFMDKAFTTIKPDSALMKQYKINQDYYNEVETIKQKSQSQIKMMQKSGKNSNYILKKKK